ncbi:AMP-binding protein [Rhizobacter sp. OV335]|uniref:AMP-binding protein n=1 Tax=Rhizobacter sp. OV335 TaxID=1500264 RepID=UPI00092167CC|nr:AMP-binding protein [Rhizobacter sp. OV335]SHM49372.1 Acyl-coenzyme A synthetase/AMP-(fatty) acid ligase [Rhizobacter sp. OV335]
MSAGPSLPQTLPLLAGAPLDAPLAWRAGLPISRRQYLADVDALARQLPDGDAVLAVCNDRYRFALSLGAAMQRGQFNLMPPNHTPDMVERLLGLFPRTHGLLEAGAGPHALPSLRFDDITPGRADTITDTPCFAPDTVVAQVLTSGSTGQPTRHAKRWDLLVENIRAEAARIARHLGRDSLAGVSLLGTVPPHHMYGFESTVLLAMLGGASFAAEKPLLPADIAAVLAQLPRPRVLVTTPFHLKTLLDAGVALPPLDLVLSATAPLSPQMAARAEAAWQAPLVEIYGCTEAGQVATRRTTDGAEWLTYDGVRLRGDGGESIVSGGHVPEPVLLADVLEVLSPTRFRLLGRSNDLINVAGKRSSLSHLNFQLNSIDGVRDGAFWLPPADSVEGIARTVAFVVTGTLTREALLAALRLRLDPVLLPRRIVLLPALPRDATGKLPAQRLAALAAEHLQ